MGFEVSLKKYCIVIGLEYFKFVDIGLEYFIMSLNTRLISNDIFSVISKLANSAETHIIRALRKHTCNILK